MQLNFKNYQKLTIKKQLKNNNFLLFSIAANQSSQSWIHVEQELKKLEFYYYKTYNNITLKVIKNSIFKKSYNLINSTFFCLIPKTKNFFKANLINILKSILFTVLSVKLDNKLYAINKLENLNSFTYKSNIAILYQSLLANFKVPYKLTHKQNISKQCDSNT